MGKNVLIIVSGSIAAYKAYDLIRSLARRGDNVKVSVTESGLRFVSEDVLRAFLKDEVYTSLWKEYSLKGAIHILLADWADTIVVFPATADIIFKSAMGVADDLASSVILASTARKIFVPAMHTNMWNNSATVCNVSRLKDMGALFVGPVKGHLSDGTEGEGHIAGIKDVIAAI